MTIIPGAGRFRRRTDPRIIDLMNRARQNRGTATWGDWGQWNQRHAQRDQYNRRRGGGGQTGGFWAGDKSRGIPGEWDHLKGDGRSRPRRRRRGRVWDDPVPSRRRRGGRMHEDGPGRYGRRRPTGRDRVIDGGWDRGGRVWDDPAPSRRRRKRKDRKKKKRRSSSKTMPISRRTFEQALNRYARRAPRDNSRYRRDFYGQNRSDVDYSRFRRDFFGHNLRPKRRQFDFRRRVGPSNYGR